MTFNIVRWLEGRVKLVSELESHLPKTCDLPYVSQSQTKDPAVRGSGGSRAANSAAFLSSSAAQRKSKANTKGGGPSDAVALLQAHAFTDVKSVAPPSQRLLYVSARVLERERHVSRGSADPRCLHPPSTVVLCV